MRLPTLHLLISLSTLVSAIQFDDGQSQFIMSTVADSDAPFHQTHPTLFDLLTIHPSVSIFFSYARETELSARFEAAGSPAITLFAPTNHAVMALPQKP
jgi:hypothetical protein